MTITKATLDPRDARTSRCLQGLCSLKTYTIYWLLLRSLAAGQHACLMLASNGMTYALIRNVYFYDPRMHDYNNHTLILEFYGEVLANAVQGSFRCPIGVTAATAVICDTPDKARHEAQTWAF